MMNLSSLSKIEYSVILIVFLSIAGLVMSIVIFEFNFLF